jgi:hypothetical protein
VVAAAGVAVTTARETATVIIMMAATADIAIKSGELKVKS